MGERVIAATRVHVCASAFERDARARGGKGMTGREEKGSQRRSLDDATARVDQQPTTSNECARRQPAPLTDRKALTIGAEWRRMVVNSIDNSRTCCGAIAHQHGAAARHCPLPLLSSSAAADLANAATWQQTHACFSIPTSTVLLAMTDSLVACAVARHRTGLPAHPAYSQHQR